jgi:hypothetical protein
MENLEAITLFFIYHWHSTYSDDDKEINKQLNEFADFAFQHNLPKIELLIKKWFDTEYSEDETATSIREELENYPVYGKYAAQATRRNVQFTVTIADTLNEDPTRHYIW